MVYWTEAQHFTVYTLLMLLSINHQSNEGQGLISALLRSRNVSKSCLLSQKEQAVLVQKGRHPKRGGGGRLCLEPVTCCRWQWGCKNKSQGRSTWSFAQEGSHSSSQQSCFFTSPPHSSPPAPAGQGKMNVPLCLGWGREVLFVSYASPGVLSLRRLWFIRAISIPLWPRQISHHFISSMTPVTFPYAVLLANLRTLKLRK